MAKWNLTINIKPIILEDQGNESDGHAAKVANEIGALIRYYGANATSRKAGWREMRYSHYGDDCALIARCNQIPSNLSTLGMS